MRTCRRQRWQRARGSERRERGFTLVEVVIAVSILGMIGALTYGTFARAMTGRDRATEITEYYHRVRQAMLRMSREISMAYLSAHRDCEDKRTETMFRASGAGGGMRLDFNSFSHYKLRADANESDQNELSYYVDRDPEDSKSTALLRREQARIDEEADEGGDVQVLAKGIERLEFEFYDAKEDRWDDTWDSTHSDYRDRLPMFVTIRMKVKNPRGEEETFVTKTRVFLKQSILIPGTGFSRCLE